VARRPINCTFFASTIQRSRMSARKRMCANYSVPELRGLAQAEGYSLWRSADKAKLCKFLNVEGKALPFRPLSKLGAEESRKRSAKRTAAFEKPAGRHTLGVVGSHSDTLRACMRKTLATLQEEAEAAGLVDTTGWRKARLCEELTRHNSADSASTDDDDDDDDDDEGSS
jgi:hypothetical protein